MLIKPDLIETLTIDGNMGKVIKKEVMNHSNSYILNFIRKLIH
jgi:hypothetical protein